MTAWKRAIWLGSVVWLFPFLVAFSAFQLKASWRSLFGSIMPLSLSVVVVVCTLSDSNFRLSHFGRTF